MSTTTAAPRHPQTTPGPQASAGTRRTRSLARYLATDNQRKREVLRIEQPDGSALVVDYLLGTLSDGRLVARLAPSEPAETAQIVCDLYLADDSRGRCRAVTPEDFQVTRHAAPTTFTEEQTVPLDGLRDAAGYVYRLREIQAETGVPELRWTRSRPSGHEDQFDAVTLRELAGSLEAYEPVCQLTQQALESAPGAPEISSSVLRAELVRVQSSPIVLNRGLREAVLRAVAREQLSMSEIALRCGRIKRDRKGNQAGETSWLARRLGLRPESGHGAPTPWIHSDVLGLIAREGLGVSPREVEL
jgi:hypothetical protein